MYCPRCGAQIADGSMFCSSCGSDLAQSRAPPPYHVSTSYGGAPYANDHRRKSEGLAILLAILLPGAGHLYAGKIAKGAAFLLTFIGASVVTYLAWALFFTAADFTVDFPWGSVPNIGLIAFTLIVAIALLIVWIYQLIDAYSVTKRFNAQLMATGQAPW